jgi:hypothetical protein
VASGIAFSFLTLRSLVGALDRVLPTLDLLELPRSLVVAAGAALLSAPATLHIAAVVQVRTPGGSGSEGLGPQYMARRDLHDVSAANQRHAVACYSKYVAVGHNAK